MPPLSFDEPDEASGRLNPKDCLNHLLLVWAVDYIENSPTRFSKPGVRSDVVVVDVVDLDQRDEHGHEGLLIRKCWWRPGRLIGSLKGRIGRPNPMLARMGQGGASPGMNAPYELVSATSHPESVTRAETWLKRNEGFLPSTPHVPMDEYVQPPAVPYQAPATTPPPPPPPAPNGTETVLERMARQAAEARQRSSHWDQPEQVPF